MIPAAKSPRPGEERERGRRDAARDLDVDAEARRAGDDRRDEHVAGPPRVLADDDRRARPRQLVRGRPAERVREVGFRSTLATPRIPSVPKSLGTLRRRRG